MVILNLILQTRILQAAGGAQQSRVVRYVNVQLAYFNFNIANLNNLQLCSQCGRRAFMAKGHRDLEMAIQLTKEALATKISVQGENSIGATSSYNALRETYITAKLYGCANHCMFVTIKTSFIKEFDFHRP